jgi:hypothetical protein
MAYASGLSGSFGYKIESTYGVPVTVDKWMPIISETLQVKRARLESAAIIAGAGVIGSDQWAQSTVEVTGGIQCELTDQSFGPLLKNALGSVSTGAPSGSYYPHTITPGATLPSLTAQVGRPNTSGTVVPWTYTGLTTSSWSLGAKVSEIATWGQEFVGYMGWSDSRATSGDGNTTNASTTATSASAAFTQADLYKPISGTNIPAGTYIDRVNSSTSVTLSAAATGTATTTVFTVGTALTSVSYASGISPISCVGGSITIGGSSVEFEEVTISGDNGLSGSRPTLNDARSRQPVPVDLRTYTATIKSDYISNSMHNAYMAGTEAAMVLTLTDGLSSYVATANMRYDDEAVNIAGRDILSDEVTGKFVRSGAADSSAISVVYTSTDSTIG